MAWYTTDHARRDAARQGACITNAKTAANSVVRPHTAETVQIDVVRYMDADGNPTCAADFAAGLVCRFYATQRFGCSETCVFADKSGPRGIWQTMTRRNNGSGTLIPLAGCPVWPNVRGEPTKEAAR